MMITQYHPMLEWQSEDALLIMSFISINRNCIGCRVLVQIKYLQATAIRFVYLSVRYSISQPCIIAFCDVEVACPMALLD